MYCVAFIKLAKQTTTYEPQSITERLESIYVSQSKKHTIILTVPIFLH